MRVLLLTDSAAFAGTEQHMLSLANGLNSLGHWVSVGSPSGSPLATRCDTSGIKTLTVEKRGVVDIGAVFTCIRYIRKNSIDVLHVHNGRTALIASLVKFVHSSVKVVLTQHFIVPTHASRRGWRRVVSDVVHRIIAGGLDRIICVSEAARCALLERGGPYSDCHSTVIHNGIDTSNYAGQSTIDKVKVTSELNIPVGSNIVLVASRLEPEKAVNVGISAFASLINDYENNVMVIAGQGSQLNELKQLTSTLGISEKVRFVGFRSDIPFLMSAADVFLFTSPVDSFGMSILEAMATGTPVVAADTGGPPEIISHRETGFLFSNGDVIDLRSKLIDCLLCTQLDEITSLARSTVENQFSITKMATATINVYESLKLVDR